MERYPLTSPLQPGEREKRERRLRWSHELADCFKDNLELLIVFLFHIFQLSQKLLMRGDHPTQSDERPHDKDVDLNRAIAIKHRGQHRNALFSKG